MSTLHLLGIAPGTDCGLISVTVGAQSDSATFNSFQLPSTLSAEPFVSDAVTGDTMTITETGLTGISARQWISDGVDISGQTGATLDTTGRMMEKISVRVTCDQGTLTSPAVTVMMSGSHNAANRAIMKCLPHDEVSHYSVDDGDWSDPTIWNTGQVPRHGANVLVSCDTTVAYDVAETGVRMDRLRVDGTLNFRTNADTEMFVETLIGAMGSTITVGTSGDRVSDGATANIKISGRHYAAASLTATDIDNDHFEETLGWSRGFISLGTVRAWGKDKKTHYKADPIEAGATSLVLRSDPVGLEVGDTLVIGGTDIDDDITLEDEEVVITGISGRTVSWSGGLTFPHKNQLVGSTRTDLYPSVMVKRGKNICLQSEVTTPLWRRGHFAIMHHMSIADLWDMESISMGRSDKSIVMGRINGSNFERHTTLSDETIVTEALTSQANIQGRYSFHVHQTGFTTDPEDSDIPIMSQCYAEDIPGWGYVHHDTRANFFGCAAYKFFGCGFVAESANELGAWNDCLAMTTTYNGTRAVQLSPKIHSGAGHKHGNLFIGGYGFGYRGRALNMASNIANSVTWGHVFLHRDSPLEPENLGPQKSLDRELLDLGDVGILGKVNNYRFDVFDPVDYPIGHFTDCESIATYGGAFVTKSDKDQYHDQGVIWKNFLSWGAMYHGVKQEYVATYINSRSDLVSGNNKADNVGSEFGSNGFQLGHVGTRVEGFGKAFKMDGSAITPAYHDQMTTTDPRWFYSGNDVIDCGEVYDFDADPDTTKLFAEVSFTDDDWDGAAIDFDRDVVDVAPVVKGVLSAADSDVFASVIANGNYKQDNLSNDGRYPRKRYNDRVIHGAASDVDEYVDNVTGEYWQYDGLDATFVPFVQSDRLTGRPMMSTAIYQIESGGSFDGSPTDSGAMDYSANAVTASDITATVAENGSVTVDVLTLASPSGGDSSFEVASSIKNGTGNHVNPDHGIVTFDYVAGEITYTPRRDYTGTDFMYLYIKSANRYATVRVDFLIGGTGAAIQTPVVDTHFSASDHTDANTIAVETFDPPDTDGRKIILVQYSTDGGSTWRRLSSFWVQAVHKLTTESDGTGITTGSYNVRLRYKTDYDYGTSSASADDAVTVT